MDQHPNDQPDALSDHQKFGEGGIYTGSDSSDVGARASDFGASTETRAEGVGDEARQGAADMKEKASNLKATLADRLESGADKLRQRSSSTRTEGQEKFSKVGDKVASGMQSTADWLRSADMQSIQQSVERQVRENPGRTLLVALGLGYVLGKVLGGNKET